MHWRLVGQSGRERRPKRVGLRHERLSRDCASRGQYVPLESDQLKRNECTRKNGVLVEGGEEEKQKQAFVDVVSSLGCSY